MTLPEFLQIRDGESFKDYHIRLYEKMDEYNIDKYTIANLLNEESGHSYDESKWRKDYAQSVIWREYEREKSLDQDILQKYEYIKLESEKEKIRNQDQKREYRKLIRNSARFEKLQDDIIYAVGQLEKVKPLPHHTETFTVNGKGKEGIALFSDFHFGANIDNNYNTYNKEIFNLRMRELVDKIIEYGMKNNISTLHIAQMGDLISGLIHVSARVQANEDIIEQVKYASEKLAEIINELAGVFDNIKYYNVIGNHSRTSPNKSDVGISENFEYLVPWFLEARLKDLDNVEITSDNDGYIMTKIANQDIIFTHGNFDNPDRSVTRLPQLTGVIPDYIISGHIHHNYSREHGKTTVIVNPSAMGADDFATQGRFSAKPSQKFLVFNQEDGLECEYIIKFKAGVKTNQTN